MFSWGISHLVRRENSEGIPAQPIKQTQTAADQQLSLLQPIDSLPPKDKIMMVLEQLTGYAH